MMDAPQRKERKVKQKQSRHPSEFNIRTTREGASVGPRAAAKREPDDVEGDSDVKAFIGNLPFDFDEAALSALLPSAVNVRIVRRHNGRSCGYGFAEFASPEDMAATRAVIHGAMVGDRELAFGSATHRTASAPPAKRAKLHDAKTLLIGGLDFEAAQGTVIDDVADVCSDAGVASPVSVTVPMSADGQRGRGYALAEFETEKAAADALTNLNGATICGRTVTCKIAKLGAPHMGHAVQSVHD